MLRASHTMQQQQQHFNNYHEQDPVHKKRRVHYDIEESDDSVQVIKPKPTNRKIMPSAAARAVVVAALVSHPEPFLDLLLTKAMSFNALNSRLKQQEQTKSQLAEELFIPRSARMNFILRASESVKETQQYKTLAAKMETTSATWKTKAKATICTVAKLEIEKL